MGQKWTSGILPIEIWHITDNRDCLASHRAVHCAERTWEEIPLLARAQASEQAPHVRSPSFVTGRCTLCSAAEYLQHLQDQRDAAKKAHGEKF